MTRENHALSNGGASALRKSPADSRALYRGSGVPLGEEALDGAVKDSVSRQKKRSVVTISLGKTSRDLLEELEERTGAENTSDVFRKALTLYDFITSKIADGYEVHLTKDNKVFILPVI